MHRRRVCLYCWLLTCSVVTKAQEDVRCVTGDMAVSEILLDEFADIQLGILATDLGLHFIVYDMPPLGAPAYRKYDIEARMPGRQLHGKVSSASDCTDYQSRRLCVRDVADLQCELRRLRCATHPRLVLVETWQQRNGSRVMPPMLQPTMTGTEVIRPVAGNAYWIKSPCSCGISVTLVISVVIDERRNMIGGAVGGQTVRLSVCGGVTRRRGGLLIM